MASPIERFQDSYDVIADFNGYLDADIAGVSDDKLLGVSVESDASSALRRITYRHYFQQPTVFTQPCGVYGYLEMPVGQNAEQSDVNGAFMYTFAEGKDENTAYYYRAVSVDNVVEQVLGLVEHALGRMIVDARLG